MSPLANGFLTAEQLRQPEKFYPLHAYVCESCLLVQLEEFESPEEIFSDYAYFSSYSSSWLEHCRAYVHQVISRFQLGAQSQVVEIASNDGYLLQYFKDQGIQVLGIEPAVNVADVARQRGIPTRSEFFGADAAKALTSELGGADLLVANNVLAHVPTLLSFVEGLKIMLKPGGAITIEFPHLLQLMRKRQFDTIYHEHFSYFSLLVVARLMSRYGLRVFDVEQVPTHGGSLRVYCCHESDAAKQTSRNVEQLLASERDAGFGGLDGYTGFARQVTDLKCEFLSFLIEMRAQGRRIAAYGAPAKGNTLLNYCGVGPDLIPYTVDRSPHKQGLYLPGTHIPIHAPEKIETERPDYVLILPWNLRDEISAQMAAIREWGGKFVTAIPSVEVF
jgi:2-polyprenyl-3-methyl-5-hydroxy-6-metoxy-1,4-benzoquinol methylase